MACVNTATNNFLKYTENQGHRQVICLGAGYDTFMIELLKENLENISLFEIDFVDVVVRKAAMICNKNVMNKLPVCAKSNSSNDFAIPNGYKFGNLSLLSADLRSGDNLLQVLSLANADQNARTLIISECVLVYLNGNESQRLVRSISEFFSSSLWFTYDMLNPHDSFGKTMVQNLTLSGYRVPGFLDFPSLPSQTDRFTANGYLLAKACDMLTAFQEFVTAEELLRVNKIERLDEVEEWNMLMQHYCITVAVHGNDHILLSIFQSIPIPYSLA